MPDTWILDSYAVLVLLQKESGGEDVLERLEQAKEGRAHVRMTWVNAGEVLTIVERRWGRETAYRVLGMLEAAGVEILPVERDLALLAAEIKAEHPLAYADAFAAALAIQAEAPLMTGDPEFRHLEDHIDIHWLRS